MKQYDSYKDSDVEWIGKIPSHWETMKIKYVSSFNDDALPDNYDPEEEIEYVEISDVNYSVGIQKTTIYKFKDAPSRARRKTKVGDIIVSTVRTYLKSIARVDKPNLIVSTGFVVLRPRIDATFMAYAVNSEPFIANVVSQSVGVSYPAISSSQVVNIKISVPSLIEQQAIASFLDTQTARIDRIIASREKKIKLLEELRASIISQAVTKGIRKDVEMKDSGIEWIGQIPKHWEVRRLKFIGRAENGLTYSPKDICDGVGYLVLRSSNIQNDKIDLKDKVYVKSIPESLKVNKGDIIICSRNGSVSLVGKSALVEEDIKATFGAFMLRYNTPYHPKFIYFLVSDVIKHYKGLFSTTTINQLTLGMFSQMYAPLAPLEEQKRIADYIINRTSQIEKSISWAQNEIRLLKEYRSSLIIEVVTGKRKVTD